MASADTLARVALRLLAAYPHQRPLSTTGRFGGVCTLLEHYTFMQRRIHITACR
jgi:hypothetical protein